MCQLKELYVTNLLEEGVRKNDKELVYKGQDKSGDLRRVHSSNERLLAAGPATGPR